MALFCPKKHRLWNHVLSGANLCDVCDADIVTGTEVKSCSICDWALCSKCCEQEMEKEFQKQREEQQQQQQQRRRRRRQQQQQQQPGEEEHERTMARKRSRAPSPFSPELDKAKSIMPLHQVNYKTPEIAAVQTFVASSHAATAQLSAQVSNADQQRQHYLQTQIENKIYTKRTGPLSTSSTWLQAELDEHRSMTNVYAPVYLATCHRWPSVPLVEALAPLRLVLAIQAPSLFYCGSFGPRHSFPIVVELRDALDRLVSTDIGTQVGSSSFSSSFSASSPSSLRLKLQLVYEGQTTSNVENIAGVKDTLENWTLSESNNTTSTSSSSSSSSSSPPRPENTHVVSFHNGIAHWRSRLNVLSSIHQNQRFQIMITPMMVPTSNGLLSHYLPATSLLTRPTRVLYEVPQIQLPLFQDFLRLGRHSDLYSHPVDDATVFVHDIHHEQKQRALWPANTCDTGTKEHHLYLKTFLDSALPFDPSGPSPGASTIHASLLQLLNAEASTLYDHPDINLKNSTNQIVSSKNQIAWYIEQRLLHETNNSTAPPPPVPSRNESSRSEPAHVSLMLLEETDQDDLLDSMESTSSFATFISSSLALQQKGHELLQQDNQTHEATAVRLAVSTDRTARAAAMAAVLASGVTGPGVNHGGAVTSPQQRQERLVSLEKYNNINRGLRALSRITGKADMEAGSSSLGLSIRANDPGRGGNWTSRSASSSRGHSSFTPGKATRGGEQTNNDFFQKHWKLTAHLSIRKTKSALEMFIKRGRKKFKEKFSGKNKITISTMMRKTWKTMMTDKEKQPFYDFAAVAAERATNEYNQARKRVIEQASNDAAFPADVVDEENLDRQRKKRKVSSSSSSSFSLPHSKGSSSRNSNNNRNNNNSISRPIKHDLTVNYEKIPNSGWCGTGWDEDGENNSRSRIDSKLQSAKTNFARCSKAGVRLCLLHNTPFTYYSRADKKQHGFALELIIIDGRNRLIRDAECYLNFKLMLEGDTSSFKRGEGSNSHHEECPQQEQDPFTFISDGRHLKNGRTFIKLRVNEHALPTLKRYVIHLTTSRIETAPVATTDPSTTPAATAPLIFPGVMEVYTRPFLCQKYIRPSQRNHSHSTTAVPPPSKRTASGELKIKPMIKRTKLDAKPSKSLPLSSSSPPSQVVAQLQRSQKRGAKRKRIKAEMERSMLEQAHVVYDLLAIKSNHTAMNNQKKATKTVVASEHDKTMRVINGEVSINLFNAWLCQSSNNRSRTSVTSPSDINALNNAVAASFGNVNNQSETINIFILKPEGSMKQDSAAQSLEPTMEDVVCFLPPHGMQDEVDLKEVPPHGVVNTSGIASGIASLPSASSSLFEILGNHIVYPNPIRTKNSIQGSSRDSSTRAYHSNNMPRRWLPGQHRSNPSHQTFTKHVSGNLNQCFTVHASNRYECLLELRKACLSAYLDTKSYESPSAVAATRNNACPQLLPPSLPLTSIESFLELLSNATKDTANILNGNDTAPAMLVKQPPFSLHTALRRLEPPPSPPPPSSMHMLRGSSSSSSSGLDGSLPHVLRTAEEYYYLLNETNPGSLLLYDAYHPQRVCSASRTGPLDEDDMYLLKSFVAPSTQYLRCASSATALANGATVRMVWSDSTSTMIELPRGCPLVLVKTFDAKAYDVQGNLLCRYEMRAVKKLQRWNNGSLVWPLEVSSHRTLVELQKI